MEKENRNVHRPQICLRESKDFTVKFVAAISNTSASLKALYNILN
jgi:hypothetical protein